MAGQAVAGLGDAVTSSGRTIRRRTQSFAENISDRFLGTGASEQGP